jgi:hypothetical protein
MYQKCCKRTKSTKDAVFKSGSLQKKKKYDEDEEKCSAMLMPNNFEIV